MKGEAARCRRASPSSMLGLCVAAVQGSGPVEATPTPVKNRRKWRTVAPFGSLLPGTRILPAKTFVDASPEAGTGIVDDHTVAAAVTAHPSIAAIIDVCGHSDLSYSVGDAPVEYIALPVPSKIVPSPAVVATFIHTLATALERHPDGIVVVHCHYGFNRTGFFLCSYMVTQMGMDPATAVRVFAECRPPGIRHESFIQELMRRYSDGTRLPSS